MTLSFFVDGIPQPGGSKKAFVIPGTNRASIVDDAKGNKDWRARVSYYAREAYQGEPMTGELQVWFEFTFPRPKDHYGSGRKARVVKTSAPYRPTVRPDLTKLIRSVEDSLTGIVWRDDAQIVWQVAQKLYGERPGVYVVVDKLDQ